MSLKPGAATKARKKPVQRRAKETVRAIVEATAHLLREGGVDAVSTNAVAVRAGVSIGSLYQYYPSRESLVAAVVEHQLAIDEAVVVAGLANLPDAFPDAVAVLARRLCAHQADNAPLLASVLPVLAVVDRERLVQRVFHGFGLQFDALLDRYVDQLHPRLRDPERRRLAVTVVVHAVRGVLNTLAVDDPTLLRDPRVQDEIAALLSGLVDHR